MTFHAFALSLCLVAAGFCCVSAADATPGPKRLLEGPLADNGQFVFAHGAQAANGAVTVEATAAEEWHEYLTTVPAKVAFAPGGTYRVSYDFELTKALSGDEPYLYHLIRGTEAGENDRGWETFTPRAGEKGRRSFVAQLPKLPDYHLILGVRYGGAVRISNLLVEDLTPGPGVVFTPYFAPGDERVELNFEAEIKNDGVEVDTTGQDEEWHEFLRTQPEKVVLKSGGKYKIGYDYQVLKPLAGQDASFYHLVRTPDGMEKDQGMEQWQAATKEKGHKDFTVELEKADGYRLILGVRFKGAIRITNLKIEDLAAKK